MSSGSACTSASLEPSYVLRALGVDEEMAHTSIRFGFGRFSTEAEVRQGLDLAFRCLAPIQRPCWTHVASFLLLQIHFCFCLHRRWTQL